MPEDFPDPSTRSRLGIAGLDDILHGGLPSDRLYLIQGDPGVGKTTLAMQFLLEGARRGEKGLYITLSETVEEIQLVAQSHGWDLSPLGPVRTHGDGGEARRHGRVDLFFTPPKSS